MLMHSLKTTADGVMGRIVPGRGSYGPYCPRKRELWAVLSQEEGVMGRIVPGRGSSWGKTVFWGYLGTLLIYKCN